MTNISFTTFLALIADNWPQAEDGLLPCLPVIERIHSHLEAHRATVMARYGLQPSDFGLLTALRRSGEPYVLSPTQLTHYMLVTSGGLTKALYRLEEKGMVERITATTDKRMRLVRLTDQGKQVIEAAVDGVQDDHRSIKQHLSVAELTELESLLMKLLSVIETPDSVE